MLYIEQLPAPGSIRGTEGQHRKEDSCCEGQVLIGTGSKNAAMLSRLSQEILFPLPKNGVLAGTPCEQAEPEHSR